MLEKPVSMCMDAALLFWTLKHFSWNQEPGKRQVALCSVPLLRRSDQYWHYTSQFCTSLSKQSYKQFCGTFTTMDIWGFVKWSWEIQCSTSTPQLTDGRTDGRANGWRTDGQTNYGSLDWWRNGRVGLGGGCRHHQIHPKACTSCIHTDTYDVIRNTIYMLIFGRTLLGR